MRSGRSAPTRSIQRTIAAGLAIAALGTVSCLPLPPPVEAAMCPKQETYVPAEVATAPLVPFPTDLAPGWQQQIPAPNAEILGRLATISGDFSVSSRPIVTVRVNGTDAAARATADLLRREFGASIDIEMGFKRLAGGPGGTATCLLLAPRWTIGERLPKGLRITVIPNRTAFDPGETLTADVRVENRTGRAIGIGPLNGRSGRGCEAPYIHQPISSISSPLAVNVSVGPKPKDVVDPESTLSGREFSRTAPGSAEAWQAMSFTCEGTASHAGRVEAGASITFMIQALPTSLAVGDDIALPAGRYDLRPLLVYDPRPPDIGSRRIDPVGQASSLRVIAAPPTRIQIGG